MTAPFEVYSIEFVRASGALQLKNHRTGSSVQAPEYVDGSRSEPVCYVAGATPRLNVVLRRLQGFTAGSYTIGASGAFGGLVPKAVTPSFGTNGLSAPIIFNFAQSLPSLVQRLTVTLEWTARRTDSPPGTTAIGSTTHRFFVILANPTNPWIQEKPWTAALNLACGWAAGARTLDEAASLIAKEYNGSGRVSYDTASGNTWYGANNHKSFNLSEMLERLEGGPGLGEKVNCTDSALTVSTLANLLGCDLWQSRMSNPHDTGFGLNPIQAIGYAAWKVPFSGSFRYHEVAWKGACSTSDRLFDGCLKIDGDDDPTTPPHTPLLPANMLFGNCNAMNYRKRLASPQGCPNCQPQASSRRRRSLV